MRFNIFEDIEMGGLHHGSGADFDVFDPDKIGSGTGGSAYGWGFYLTEILYTATEYATTVAMGRNDRLKEKLIRLVRAYCINKNIPYDIGSDIISEIPFIDERNQSKPLKEVLQENSYQAIKRNFINNIVVEDDNMLIAILNDLYPEIEEIIKNWRERIVYYIKLVKDEGDFNFIGYTQLMPEKKFMKIIDQLKEEGYGYYAERLMYDFKSHQKNQLGTIIYDYLKNEIFDGNGKDVSMFLLRAGFDGIYVSERSFYVIFDPNIIRIVEKTNV